MMSESYSRQSKSSRRSKETESVRSKPRSKYSEHKYPQMESKTPPLPTKNTSTLDELIKKRESLKQELKKIVKYSDNEVKNIKKRRHSRDEYASDIKLKRIHKENDNKSNISKKKSAHLSSPELDNAQVESEDEETIIEQRRQQRKQLLEKFNASADTSKDVETKVDDKSDENKTIQATQNQQSSKEVTDMFSEKDEFVSKVEADSVTQGSNDANLNLTDNWDDPEGYYNIRVGDIIHKKYTIKGILGQGVFANVVRVQDLGDGNDYYAIKIVRNNDLMYRTSLKEIAILREIRDADPTNKYHCVQLIGHFMHKGHLCILLESLHMDLRAVIKKYGRHHGINMKALISYSRQLLLALRLLRKLGIVHADIKPDNILVNEKKNVLKLCDFGSACKIDDNEPTPYLVSRFYRAPEIILGVSYKHSVDIWSTACTIYEMATGKILFTGSSNNKMLKCFMDLKGKFSSKMIKRGKFKDQHFNYNNNFLLHKKDEFTGREKVVELSNIVPIRDLGHELKKAYKNASAREEKKIVQLKDLLDKMTMLDSSQRLSVTDCLKHPFIFEDLEKDPK
ncbi:serine/threonine-protein kinase PRP4 homolog [Anticarsia gemmatalis]|uniref:serine/threonine-protein kinase PRP4 homolog n=1 Tax=Anticarsia gemmatalis TaxID=129554 RepID=UPI003F776ADC